MPRTSSDVKAVGGAKGCTRAHGRIGLVMFGIYRFDILIVCIYTFYFIYNIYIYIKIPIDNW